MFRNTTIIVIVCFSFWLFPRGIVKSLFFSQQRASNVLSGSCLCSVPFSQKNTAKPIGASLSDSCGLNTNVKFGGLASKDLFIKINDSLDYDSIVMQTFYHFDFYENSFSHVIDHIPKTILS